MLEDSYLCESNIEAANIMIDKEWEKARNIKQPDGRVLYLGLSCLYPSSVWEYWSILFLTHGGV